MGSADAGAWIYLVFSAALIIVPLGYIAWQQRRIHALVNDQMTREKEARLDDLRTQRTVLRRVLGDDMTEADKDMPAQMDHRAEQLALEIDKRDAAARRAQP